MKALLDPTTIDSLSAVELPDRNVICDCGCSLIEINILSGDTFYIGSFDTVNNAINACGYQVGGTQFQLLDSNGNVIFDTGNVGIESVMAYGSGGIDQAIIDQTQAVNCFAAAG